LPEISWFTIGFPAKVVIDASIAGICWSRSERPSRSVRPEAYVLPSSEYRGDEQVSEVRFDPGAVPQR
jgi:hypothetical protein